MSVPFIASMSLSVGKYANWKGGLVRVVTLSRRPPVGVRHRRAVVQRSHFMQPQRRQPSAPSISQSGWQEEPLCLHTPAEKKVRPISGTRLKLPRSVKPQS